MEIDWSKAPEGATHHNQFAGRWIKHFGNGNYQFLSGVEWEMGFGCMDSRYVQKPEQSAWTGEGLPPVGTVCEASNGGTSVFFKCEVVAVHYATGRPILKTEGFGGPSALTLAPECWKFRPIRTPEQIAAEERERAIDDLCASIVSHYEAPKMSEHYLGLARALHDAGYRKQA